MPGPAYLPPDATPRVLIVSSVGGHLTEVMRLRPWLATQRVSLVLNAPATLPEFPFEHVYRIAHAERDWRVIKNMFEAAWILQQERPALLLSVGAGPVVPFALLARALTRCRIVYIETAASVTRPSLTGRLMKRLAHVCFYQWPAMARFFPSGQLTRMTFL